MTEQAPKKRRAWWKLGAVAGVVLGLACHAVPVKYRAACEAASHVIAICTGGN